LLARSKVFGCDAKAHILEQKRMNLDPKIHKCIFLGYREEVKDFELYDYISKDVFLCRVFKLKKKCVLLLLYSFDNSPTNGVSNIFLV
jgi:hypothetical protein